MVASTWRHSLASKVLADALDFREVQHRLGHAHRNLIDRCARVRPNALGEPGGVAELWGMDECRDDP